MLFLWLVLAAAALLLTAGLICLRTAVCRGREKDPLDPKTIAHSTWAKYSEAVLSGAAWISEQRAETVTLTSFDGLRLSARLISAPQNLGTILLFHGYRSAASVDFSCGARLYHDYGLNLLLVDQRSHGNSEGKYITYGVLERQDCHRWAAYCAKRFGPALPLFLAGVSMGATTVLMAADLPLPGSVRGIIADCGFTSPRDIIRSVMAVRYHLPAFLMLYVLDWLTRLFAGFSLSGASTVEALSHTQIPVLLIHGTGDHFVPCRMSREAYDACASEKHLLLVEGAGHGASFLVDTQGYTAALHTFLDAHLHGG